MKITRRQLRQIINEEVSKLLLEKPPLDVMGGGLITVPSDISMQAHMKDPTAKYGADLGWDEDEDVDPEKIDDTEDDGDEPGV